MDSSLLSLIESILNVLVVGQAGVFNLADLAAFLVAFSIYIPRSCQQVKLAIFALVEFKVHVPPYLPFCYPVYSPASTRIPSIDAQRSTFPYSTSLYFQGQTDVGR